MDIERELLNLRDEEYKRFNGTLVPEKVLIGVRIPDIRILAKRIVKENPEEAESFIEDLPHYYLEENHLHAFILMEEKDKFELIKKTENFLPFVDNWQTCDSFMPTFFKNDKELVPDLIKRWLSSDHEYTVRYGIRLMIGRKDFSLSNMEDVIRVGKSEYYYVFMAAAWYLSMAALENREEFLTVFSKEHMGEKLYSATIKKILESRQFSKVEKTFFRSKKTKTI